MQTLLKHWADALLEWLGLASAQDSGWDRWVAFTLVLLAVALFDFVCRTILVRGMRRIVKRTKATWDDDLFNPDVLSRLCNVVSAVVLGIVLPVVFEEQSEARTIVTRLVEVYIVVAVFRFINAVLFAVFQIASARPAWQNKPIKGLRQTGQGIAALICAILIVSILLDKSPTILLTGLGASAAVLMLIFRDSILGFVSGIQLSANDMLKVGDWISVPKYGADGNVEEVSLTTVKIRNWDNTLVMLPPYLLTTDSFTNWHAMQLSGGRRVMRSVSIDMTSVRFCTPEMLDHYRTIDLIKDYVEETERRIEAYNAAHGIVPKTVMKSVRDVLQIGHAADEGDKKRAVKRVRDMSEDELHLLICSTEEKMLQAAANLDFELAAKLRDKLFELQGKKPEELPEETVALPQRKRRRQRKPGKYLKA